MTVLLLEDKLGITEGYMSAWTSMMLAAGFQGVNIVRQSLYRNPYMRKHTLLMTKGNRKSPGFNPELIPVIREWLEGLVTQYKPRLIICMDPACFGLVEPAWDIAITDNLRGGVYDFESIPFLITMPISAIHAKKNPKDIRALNDGASDRQEWEEQRELSEEESTDMFFIEPYTIPYGRWVLAADLRKGFRLYMGAPDVL